MAKVKVVLEATVVQVVMEVQLEAEMEMKAEMSTEKVNVVARANEANMVRMVVMDKMEAMEAMVEMVDLLPEDQESLITMAVTVEMEVMAGPAGNLIPVVRLSLEGMMMVKVMEAMAANVAVLRPFKPVE